MPAKREDSEAETSRTCSCSSLSNKALLQVKNECPVNEVENTKKDRLLEDIRLSDLVDQFERTLKRVKELELCHLVEPIETTLCKLKQLDEITETLVCEFFDANSHLDKGSCDDRETLTPPKSADQRFFDAVCTELAPSTTKTTCCSKKSKRKKKKTKPTCSIKTDDDDYDDDDSPHSCGCESCHCASQGSLSSCPLLPPYDDADDEEEPVAKDNPKCCVKKINKKKEDKCELPCGCDASSSGKRSRSLGCRLASRLRSVDVTSGFQIKADARARSVAVNRTRSVRTDTTYHQVPVDEAVSCNLPTSRSSVSNSSSLAEYESERSSLNGDGIAADGGGAGCRANQKDRFRRPPRGPLNTACESAKGDQSSKQSRGGGCGCGRRSTNCENEAQLTCPCGCGDLMALPQQSCDQRCDNCGKEILDALEAEFYAEIRSQRLLDDGTMQDVPQESCQQETFPGEDRLPPIFHTDIKSYIESLEDKCKEKDKIIKELKEMIEEK